MSDLKTRTRLLTVGNPMTYREVKENSKSLRKTGSMGDEKSPVQVEGEDSTFCDSESRESGNSCILHSKFELEVEKLSDEEICKNFNNDPIFKNKFSIWMRKAQQQRQKNESKGGLSKKIFEDQSSEFKSEGSTFKENRSIKSAHNDALLDRCQALVAKKLVKL